MIENVKEYKYACKEFLSSFALNALRSYARSIGVCNPTKDKKKNVLIEEIVAVLAGEVLPQMPSTRGAPVKNDFVDPKLIEGMKEIRKAHVEKGGLEDTLIRLREVKEHPYLLRVAEPSKKELENTEVNTIYNGQLETVNGIAVLLPLDCVDSYEKLVVPMELIHIYDLQEGDVISCVAERRQNLLLVVNILQVNGQDIEYFQRGDFDSGKVCYPYQRIKFCEKASSNTMVAKVLEWLVVIGKGQRGLVVSPPKSGKTTLLMDMAISAKRANKNLSVISVLVDQAPEAISFYKAQVGGENVLFTTYEDSPERQMFIAEFALKRAKRYAETGRDVLLIIDSLNALSRAFNETDASIGGKTLAGGLESKTIQYLKRYFGTARCLEDGGSLTIIGALSVATGNPADDLLRAELAPVSNLEIVMSEDLAKRRIFPPIDLFETRGKRTSATSGLREGITNDLIRSDYLSAFSTEDLYRIIMDAENFQDMENKVFKQLKTKNK